MRLGHFPYLIKTGKCPLFALSTGMKITCCTLLLSKMVLNVRLL